jgi:signal transduction histidine kinase/CheY-like chemotaxis protein/CHASE3 domain sensor protein
MGDSWMHAQVFKKLLRRAVLFPLFLSLFSGICFVALFVYYISAIRWVQHSDEVALQGRTFMRYIVDAETGERGYLLTGQREYLEPFDGAVSQLPSVAEKWRGQVIDNRFQSDRVRAIWAKYETWVRYATRARQIKEEGRLNVAAELPQKLAMDQIRQGVREFLDAEERLRADRIREVRRFTILLLVAIVLAGVLRTTLLAVWGRRQLSHMSAIYTEALTVQQKQNDLLQYQQWLSSGQAQLAEKVRGELPVTDVASAVIQFLVEYVGALSGSVYILHEGILQPEVQFANPRITAATVKIDNKFYAPFKADATVLGFIELSFAEPVLDKIVKFVSHTSEAVGVAIRSAQYRMRHGELLSEVRTQSDLLQAQMALLTEAKEAAENSSRLKSQFLANMSHEIRTPLTSMVGYSELLIDGQLTPEERGEYVDVIRRNSAVLAHLIDDILDLSKVESNFLDLEYLEFSPSDLVREVIKTLTPHVQRKSIFLEMREKTDLPLTIVSDPTRLRQVLINMMNNAIKFTNRGGVTVSLSYSSQPPTFSFEIEDTGIGIAQEHQERLFQPFVQGDNSTTRKYGGTGLGLVLARRLARLLGGDVNLLNSSAEGSHFCIEIAAPSAIFIEDMNSEFGQEKLSSDVSTLPSLQGLRILLIEDMEDNRTLFKSILERAQATVDVAQNGLDGLHSALAREYDVVLMDLQMPVMDGYTVIRALREKNYAKPIIAVTAHAMSGERSRCLHEGCSDYLTKPIDQLELIETILKHVPAPCSTPEISVQSLVLK